VLSETAPDASWSIPAEMPKLGDHEAHVWCVPVADGVSERWVESLSSDERETMQRFRHDRDAVRYATGRAALRILLGRYLESSARAIVFDRTCRYCGASHGKPRVDNRRDLDFNLSSSDQIVLIAVAAGCVVGVDVETTSRIEATAMAALVLAPSESRTFDNVGARAFDLVQTWCCKEAVLKATGHGLGIDPRSIVVAPEDERFRVVDAPADHAELLDFAILRLALRSGYAGAIALRPLPPRLRLFAASHDQLLDA
jgi:4'-phosphopantetheinyl transferase